MLLQHLFSLTSLIAVLSLFSSVNGATVQLDWNITWVNVNPDGRFPRPAIGINGQWPCPTLEVNLGDRVIVNITNQLGNETTGLHFHGIRQYGTNQMDGPRQTNQCGLPPGLSMVYDFTVEQAGTFWYHSHDKGQYPDGLRGPMIVHDPSPPFTYDDELILTTSDWWHAQAPEILNFYNSARNTKGEKPSPDSNLLNEAQDAKLNVEAGKTYLVHIISMAASASNFIGFDQHEVTIVEVDGIYTQKRSVTDMIEIAPAQRYGVLLTAKQNATQNYGILSSFDPTTITPSVSVRPNVTASLIYDDSKPLPETPIVNSLVAVDDFSLVPYDQEPIYSVDRTITLNVSFDFVNGSRRGFMNDITYLDQTVPTLYTVLSAGNYSSDPRIYGKNANAYVLDYNSTIELVVNNFDTDPHPFHLHGHQFQVVARSERDAGTWNGATWAFPDTPIRRDTVQIYAMGYTVLRFKADNPGVFLFHCHIEWHVDAGLTMTFIEAPDQLQGLVIPEDHLDACKAGGTPTTGNAAGNTRDYTDLTGENTHVPDNPIGAVVPVTGGSRMQKAKRAPVPIPRYRYKDRLS